MITYVNLSIKIEARARSLRSMSHCTKRRQLCGYVTPTVWAIGLEFAENVAAGCANIVHKCENAPGNLLSVLTRNTILLKSSTVYAFTVATSMSVLVWKRFLAAETLGHSHTACHSESTTIVPRLSIHATMFETC